MAPIASNRSASCTHWSSRHVRCQSVIPPSSCNLVSVDQETLSMILHISKARPSVTKSISGHSWESDSKKGLSNSNADLLGSVEYFLSFMSWKRADNSTTNKSILGLGWTWDWRRSAIWRAVLLTRFTRNSKKIELNVMIFYKILRTLSRTM